MAGTGRNTFNEIVIEPLTKENRDTWFAWVKTYLIAQDLWEVIDGTFEKPPEDIEGYREDFKRWRRKNATALHAIQISCAPESSNHIIQISEAKEAWNVLNSIYKNNYKEQEPPREEMEREVDFDVGALGEALRNDRWENVRKFFTERPDGLHPKLDSKGQTILHVAASQGCMDIVEKLVLSPEVSPECLAKGDHFMSTPLSIVAAFGGDKTRVAECMVGKNPRITEIATQGGALPVTLAFDNGNTQMGLYLYSKTPLDCLKPDKGRPGPQLLICCLFRGYLGVALDLLRKCPELLFAGTQEGLLTPIMMIASMPSAFSNGSALWKRWLYKCITRPSSIDTKFIRVDIEQQSQNKRASGLLQKIYEMKLLDDQADEIIKLVCKEVNTSDKIKAKALNEALIFAAKKGFVKFVDEIMKKDNSVALHEDSSGQNIFFHAVENHQYEVFKLIHKNRFKNTILEKRDKEGNNMLHLAANLAPPSQLNLISGPTLQMQSEMQWFKKVDSVVRPQLQVLHNYERKTAEEKFKENHNELRKNGEKWMRDTASSCSVVGTLVVGIMFGAAFGVPGGNNQTGYPIFLSNNKFLLFIISDALSLFSSTTSVLIFLGILTSRYAEEDFLESLPRKLILGLLTLFISIVSMMIAFSASILLMVQHTYSWSFILLIIFGIVPIIPFVVSQFPPLVKMTYSTYGRGIFKTIYTIIHKMRQVVKREG